MVPVTTAQELLEIIANGENSGVEFKRENLRAEHLAEEISAFANIEGGMILLGVRDDGLIEGFERRDMEQWLMNICSHNVNPAIIPSYETIRIEGKIVAVLKIPKGINKPYQVSSGKYFARVGSTKRLVSREDLARLFRLYGEAHYDIIPVLHTSEKDLDTAKLREYFLDFNYLDIHEEPPELRRSFLVNAGILAETGERYSATVGGLLIFGRDPVRRLPQSGISYARFKGGDVTTDILDRKEINGTLPDVVDRCTTILRDGIAVPMGIQDLKGEEKEILPAGVLREALVNAVIHRDYSITGSKIRVFRFPDRIEVRSPGCLPNGISVEKMLVGTFSARNAFLFRWMHNLGFGNRLGRGVPMMIKQTVTMMGREPRLEERDEEFVLIIYLS